jgi:hypothetical protein
MPTDQGQPDQPERVDAIVTPDPIRARMLGAEEAEAHAAQVSGDGVAHRPDFPREDDQE